MPERFSSVILRYPEGSLPTAHKTLYYLFSRISPGFFGLPQNDIK